MKDPTPHQVINFWNHMQTSFGTTVVNKDDDELMELVAWFLDSAGIMDHKTFMVRYTTTIDKKIFIPFEIGVEDHAYSPWGQMKVCVHEHQHAFQADRDSFARFAYEYLSNPDSRAHYEAEALAADLEFHFWRYGSIYDIDRRVTILKGYACGQAQIDYAADYLKARAETIKAGGVASEAAKAAIEWGNNHAPLIRAS